MVQHLETSTKRRTNDSMTDIRRHLGLAKGDAQKAPVETGMEQGIPHVFL
jgi:hypothetical protein